MDYVKAKLEHDKFTFYVYGLRDSGMPFYDAVNAARRMSDREAALWEKECKANEKEDELKEKETKLDVLLKSSEVIQLQKVLTEKEDAFQKEKERLVHSQNMLACIALCFGLVVIGMFFAWILYVV